ACGHQMHFDSDNEGIGGALHPICSCVVYVDAPDGVGGPTLVTDQRLSDDSLATKGWLVYPKPGRLAIYDGSYLHGVVPGRGEPPASAAGAAQPRRITWMLAFWRQIKQRPFEEDGLAGSSRPLPDPAAAFETGTRRFTWHQKLALPLPGLLGDEAAAKLPLPSPVPMHMGVWVPVDEAGSNSSSSGSSKDTGAVPVPDYSECWQF
ncbi:unnamed protein product, partial [Polarella glacialis]